MQSVLREAGVELEGDVAVEPGISRAMWMTSGLIWLPG